MQRIPLGVVGVGMVESCWNVLCPYAKRSVFGVRNCAELTQTGWFVIWSVSDYSEL